MVILRADWQSALTGPYTDIGKQVANLPHLPAPTRHYIVRTPLALSFFSALSAPSALSSLAFVSSLRLWVSAVDYAS
jgi:hypothetical protein